MDGNSWESIRGRRPSTPGSASIQTAYTNTVSSLPLFDPRLRRAPSDFNVPQTATINGIWEVPAWNFSVTPLAWLERGWQFSNILVKMVRSSPRLHAGF